MPARKTTKKSVKKRSKAKPRKVTKKSDGTRAAADLAEVEQGPADPRIVEYYRQRNADG